MPCGLLLPPAARSKLTVIERPVAPVTVAISACLAGQFVRYDGTNAVSELPQDALAAALRFKPVCPETGIGMSTPRPPIGLYQDAIEQGQKADTTRIRVLQVDDLSRDYTAALTAYAEQQAPQLSQANGYILMKNSPSCGLYTVKVRELDNEAEEPRRDGRGAFAAAISRLLPQLPLEENERLFDAAVRYQFLTRVYAHAHWRRLVAAGVNAKLLLEFHSRYKYLLLAFSQQHYREVGQLLSQLKPFSDVIAQRYFVLLMEGLAVPATREGHVNALQHLQGYLKNIKNQSQRDAVQMAVQAFAEGREELQLPLRRLRSAFAAHREIPQMRYAWQQVYLDPVPPACC